MRSGSMSIMAEVFGIFECLESTTKRTEKEDILKSNKDNKVLQDLLLATYDPFVVYGVKKDPGVQPTCTVFSDMLLTEFKLVLRKLSNREVTGKDALDMVKQFFTTCNPTEYKWYLRILQRDLKVGITEKTINKIWKGLVPEFTCALAENLNPSKLPKEFVVDTKLDGYRCLAFKYDSGKVELRSRKGHLLEGFYGIEKDVENYLPAGFIYDGEITSRQNKFNDMQRSAFKKSAGVDKDGILNIFDVVSIDEFVSGKGKVTYRERIAFLNQIDDVLEGCRSLQRVVQSEELHSGNPEDVDMMFTLHTQFTNAGYEGTMIKDVHAVYKKGKSRNIQKLKDFYDIDLEVTGVYEGKPGTKYEGKLGGVIVQLSDKDIINQCPVDDPKHAKKLKYVPDLTCDVRVGSGWSDTQRVQYWENPNGIIGKTITISFQETSINDNNEHSLRFPTLVKVRDDK